MAYTIAKLYLMKRALILLFLSSFSSFLFAQTATFLGVPINNATRDSINEAVAEKGGKRMVRKMHDAAFFPANVLPAGIKGVEFFFTEEDELVGIKMKIPGMTIHENASKANARMDGVIASLKDKYGRPVERKIAGVITNTFEYQWECANQTRIILIDKGVVLGGEISYVNDRLAKPMKSGNSERQKNNL